MYTVSSSIPTMVMFCHIIIIAHCYRTPPQDKIYMCVLCTCIAGLKIHGRRHDFGTGGGGVELEVERKMCACAQIFDHNHQYVNMPTYSA